MFFTTRAMESRHQYAEAGMRRIREACETYNFERIDDPNPMDGEHHICLPPPDQLVRRAHSLRVIEAHPIPGIDVCVIEDTRRGHKYLYSWDRSTEDALSRGGRVIIACSAPSHPAIWQLSLPSLLEWLHPTAWVVYTPRSVTPLVSGTPPVPGCRLADSALHYPKATLPVVRHFYRHAIRDIQFLDNGVDNSPG